jgi:homoserine kinase type II
VATAEQVRAALRATWHRAVDDCVALPSGLDAGNWAVRVGAERYVARTVAAGRRGPFEAGLAAAQALLAARGPAGTPVPAVDGRLTVPLPGGEVIALLRSVPGRPLEPADPVDQQWWGDALGAAHHRLSGFRHPGVGKFHTVRPDAPYLDALPDVQSAVAAAVRTVRRLFVTDQLTYGLLHGDPAPSAFRIDPLTGRLGLVDWGPVASGPLMYDLASAVAYAGGPVAARDLIEAYLAAGPVPRDEMDAALPTMLMLRWAVEADHFAQRLAARRRDEARETDRARLDRALATLVELIGGQPA